MPTLVVARGSGSLHGQCRCVTERPRARNDLGPVVTSGFSGAVVRGRARSTSRDRARRCRRCTLVTPSLMLGFGSVIATMLARALRPPACRPHMFARILLSLAVVGVTGCTGQSPLDTPDQLRLPREARTVGPHGLEQRLTVAVDPEDFREPGFHTLLVTSNLTNTAAVTVPVRRA